VLCGGSWRSSRVYVRAAFRHSYDLDHRDFNLGFRLCCESPFL
jgi:formylglycine-generating enzyme required for sulfatase activity